MCANLSMPSLPPAMQFLNRPDWSGTPFIVGGMFRLKKGNRTARCQLRTHPLEWELRLSVGDELLQSQVCRTQDEVLDTTEKWKAATKGPDVTTDAFARAVTHRATAARPR